MKKDIHEWVSDTIFELQRFQKEHEDSKLELHDNEWQVVFEEWSEGSFEEGLNRILLEGGIE